jgi:hypothetical protein
LRENLIKELEIANQKLVEEKVRLEVSKSLIEMKEEILSDTKIEPELEIVDKDLEEFLYILTKNLEAKKVTAEKFNQRLGSNLKVQNVFETVLYFLGKTLGHTDALTIQDYLNRLFIIDDTKDDINDKLNKLLSSIVIFSPQDEEQYRSYIHEHLKSDKSILNIFIENDSNKTGYISFNTFRRILNEINIKFEEDMVEFIIYSMKKIDDPNSSIYDLQYSNLFCKDFDFECLFKKLADFENFEELLQDVVTITESDNSYTGIYLKSFSKTLQIYLEIVSLDHSDERKLLNRLKNSKNIHNVEIIDLNVLRENVFKYKYISLVEKVGKYLQKESLYFEKFISDNRLEEAMGLVNFLDILKKQEIIQQHIDESKIKPCELKLLCNNEKVYLYTLDALIKAKTIETVFTEDGEVDVLDQFKLYLTSQKITVRHFYKTIKRDIIENDDREYISKEHFINYLKAYKAIPKGLDKFDSTNITGEILICLDDLADLLRENIIKDIVIYMKDKDYHDFIKELETSIESGYKTCTLVNLLSYLKSIQIVNPEVEVEDIDPIPFGKALKDGQVNLKKLKNIVVCVENLVESIKSYMLKNNLKSEGFLELFADDTIDNNFVNYKRFTQILREHGIIPSKKVVNQDYVIFLNEQRQIVLDLLKESIKHIDSEIDLKLEQEQTNEKNIEEQETSKLEELHTSKLEDLQSSKLEEVDMEKEVSKKELPNVEEANCKNSTNKELSKIDNKTEKHASADKAVNDKLLKQSNVKPSTQSKNNDKVTVSRSVNSSKSGNNTKK